MSPPGPPSRNYRLASPVDMLAAASGGERFRCGEISTLLARLIIAGGTKARVALLLGPCYRAHVVTEMWSAAYRKWCVIDADTNHTYLDSRGVPCSVLDLHDRVAANNYSRIRLVAGSGIYRDPRVTLEWIPQYLSRGFAITPTRVLPTLDPLATHPFLKAVYVGDSRVWQVIFRTCVAPHRRARVCELFSSPFDIDSLAWVSTDGDRTIAPASRPDRPQGRWARATASWYYDRVLSPLYERDSQDPDFREAFGLGNTAE